jgi:hypothetical protein
MAFNDTWAAVQARLKDGLTIPNWTAHKGAVGDPFRIDDVGNDVIVVNAPGATTLQPGGARGFRGRLLAISASPMVLLWRSPRQGTLTK